MMVVGLQPTDLIRGDRGVLTSARIEQTLRPAGLDWITALRAPAIKQLAAAGGPLQPSLFDDRDMPTGHMWMAPGSQGFFRVSATEGRFAVMCPACGRGQWPQALMGSVDRGLDQARGVALPHDP
jgi:hypothetical protein